MKTTATKTVQPLNPYVIGSNVKLNNNPYMIYAVIIAKSKIKDSKLIDWTLIESRPARTAHI